MSVCDCRSCISLRVAKAEARVAELEAVVDAARRVRAYLGDNLAPGTALNYGPTLREADQDLRAALARLDGEK